MTILSRRGPGGRASGPRPAGSHRWRAVVVQSIALLAVFTAQAALIAGARADLRADQGAGPVIPVAAPVAEVSPPVSLAIPKLKINTRLIGLRKDQKGQLQVPEDPKRVGWYSQGFAPGDDGPAVLVGHVDSYRGSGIFARLSSMAPGDPIAVRRADGSVGEFVVQKVETYAKRDFPTEEVYRGDGTTSLRLVTCGGDFDPRAKSYLSNVVVFAAPA